jgi:urea transport system substrate-binding protein
VISIKAALIAGITTLLAVALLWTSIWVERYNNQTIEVGILHSLTGTIAMSALPVVDATCLAIEEINQHGGVLNKKLIPIILDARSDEKYTPELAEELLTKDHVAVIFGCWTSACRKSVLQIVERHNALLIYPVQYEGLEQSPNILYLGSAPNQQILPAIKWAYDHLGQHFFLVGSDYIFPRTANAIIKDQIATLQEGTIVGEEYLKLGSQDVAAVIAKIKATKPDVIINTINGDSNVAFFRQLAKAGITSKQIPVMSFSLSESDIPAIGVEYLKGHYAAGNYFQSIKSEENATFVAAFKRRYGTSRTISDAMEAAYAGVYLWAQAVEACGSTSPPAVISSLREQSFQAPEGILSVDAKTLHLWKKARIGRINGQGQFDVVWDSIYPLRPKPYPPTRSPHEWQQFLQELYKSWYGAWSQQDAVHEET